MLYARANRITRYICFLQNLVSEQRYPLSAITTHLHNFSPPAVTPTSCRRRNSNLGYRFVFIFYLLASPCSLLGSLLALGWFTVLSLNISYCYGIVCVAVQRNVDSNFVSVWYVLIFWLGNLLALYLWFDPYPVLVCCCLCFRGDICWIRWSGCGEWPLDVLIIGILRCWICYLFGYS